jgi:hypothetical protein
MKNCIKLKLGKKLTLSKEKLNYLNQEQLSHFMGGRIAAATSYTSGATCDCCGPLPPTACCSIPGTICCC